MAEKFGLLPQVKQQIDHWVAKFPDGKQRSAILAALHIIQDEYDGYLTEPMLVAVAKYLDMPPIQVHEVASFYAMYDQKPVGKNKIYVCTNIACQLCGSDKIMAHVEKKLDIKAGQTTTDGQFTLKEFECLGACTGAPMMQVNKDYHENLTPQKVDSILAEVSTSKAKSAAKNAAKSAAKGAAKGASTLEEGSAG